MVASTFLHDHTGSTDTVKDTSTKNLYLTLLQSGILDDDVNSWKAPQNTESNVHDIAAMYRNFDEFKDDTQWQKILFLRNNLEASQE